MVTTFSPPARPKKPKKDILPIALGVVAALLLAGFVYYFLQTGAKSNQAETLASGVLGVAEAAGSSAVTAESLSDTPEAALKALADEVGAKLATLDGLRNQAEQATASLNQAQSELAGTLTQLNDATTQLDAARRDASARATELSEARQSAQSAQQEAARLQGVVAGLEARLRELEGERVQTGGEPEEVDAKVEDASPVAVAEEPVAEEPVAKEAEVKPSAKKSTAFVVPEGVSRTFKTVRYDPRKSTLTFITVDDQMLTYNKVPDGVYDELINAPVFDVYYRFRILDVFESDPNDRDLLKTIRR